LKKQPRNLTAAAPALGGGKVSLSTARAERISRRWNDQDLATIKEHLADAAATFEGSWLHAQRLSARIVWFPAASIWAGKG
jgi:hypothetical protein